MRARALDSSSCVAGSAAAAAFAAAALLAAFAAALAAAVLAAALAAAAAESGPGALDALAGATASTCPTARSMCFASHGMSVTSASRF